MPTFTPGRLASLASCAFALAACSGDTALVLALHTDSDAVATATRLELYVGVGEVTPPAAADIDMLDHMAVGAKLFDRPAISLRSLAVALTVVVLYQPEAVATPGFQMSFAASGALIALYEMWPKMERPDRPGILVRIRAWIIGATATSLVASLATMPFALHHFDRAALFSVIANIVSTPVITLWTTPPQPLPPSRRPSASTSPSYG